MARCIPQVRPLHPQPQRLTTSARTATIELTESALTGSCIQKNLETSDRQPCNLGLGVRVTAP